MIHGGVKRPGYGQGFARNAGQSEAPEQWRGEVLAGAAFLGCQGGALYDVSGYGNHGILTNFTLASAWGTGNFGTQLSFSGDNDYLDFGSASILDDLVPMSMSFWVLYDPAAQAAGAGPQFSKVTDTLTNGWFFGPTDTGALFFTQAFSVGGGEWETAGGVILANVWTHVGLTYDGSSPANVPSFYLNGRLNSVGVGSATGTRSSDAANTLRFGIQPNDLLYFVGAVDDLRIFNRILQPAEMLAIYLDPFARYRLRPRTLIAPSSRRLTKNTHARPLGLRVGMDRQMTRIG